jgi:hypothetical protein
MFTNPPPSYELAPMYIMYYELAPLYLTTFKLLKNASGTQLYPETNPLEHLRYANNLFFIDSWLKIMK